MSKKAWAVVGIAGLVAAAYLTRGSGRSAPADAPDELVNRIWIDALPTSAKQKVDVFVMVDEPQLGQFASASAYEGDFALFEWRDAGKGVRIVMLQTEKAHELSFSVTRDGCDPFDLCMKVKGAPRGAKRYYSMKDWVIEPGRRAGLGDVEAFLREHVGAPPP